MNFDDFKLSVEALSGGKRTVLFDDLGYPSVMNVIPLIHMKELGLQADGVHPAFIVNDDVITEFYFSTFLNIVKNNRAYSLPLQDPAVSKNRDTFKGICEQKGPGWHMASNAEWSAISLLSKKMGTIPRGNNYYGCDIEYKHEKGIKAPGMTYTNAKNQGNMAYKEVDGTFYHVGRTLTGSGPDTWNHDHTANGIADMNGNVWEWVSGMRLMDGEIQVIPNNNSAAGIDEGRESTNWRAMLQDGTLVMPGTEDTLKYDGKTAGDDTATDHYIGGVRLNTQIEYPNYTGENPGDNSYGYGYQNYQTIAPADGVTAPEILKALCLYPLDNNHNGDYFYYRNYGERLPLRGGDWYSSANAGLFYLYLFYRRSSVSPRIGYRSAFVKL